MHCFLLKGGRLRCSSNQKCLVFCVWFRCGTSWMQMAERAQRWEGVCVCMCVCGHAFNELRMWGDGERGHGEGEENYALQCRSRFYNFISCQRSVCSGTCHFSPHRFLDSSEEMSSQEAGGLLLTFLHWKWNHNMFYLMNITLAKLSMSVSAFLTIFRQFLKWIILYWSLYDENFAFSTALIHLRFNQVTKIVLIYFSLYWSHIIKQVQQRGKCLFPSIFPSVELRSSDCVTLYTKKTNPASFELCDMVVMWSKKPGNDHQRT